MLQNTKIFQTRKLKAVRKWGKDYKKIKLFSNRHSDIVSDLITYLHSNEHEKLNKTFRFCIEVGGR